MPAWKYIAGPDARWMPKTRALREALKLGQFVDLIMWRDGMLATGMHFSRMLMDRDSARFSRLIFFQQK
jgi:hypothetical protein